MAEFHPSSGGGVDVSTAFTGERPLALSQAVVPAGQILGFTPSGPAEGPPDVEVTVTVTGELDAYSFNIAKPDGTTVTDSTTTGQELTSGWVVPDPFANPAIMVTNDASQSGGLTLQMDARTV